MRKLLVLAVGVMALMLYAAGCGSKSSGTVATVYSVPAAVDIEPSAPQTTPPTLTLLGGAIQGGVSPAAIPTNTIFIGSSAGFLNHSTAVSPPAKFNRPLALTTDGPNLYVADYLNNAIRKIDKTTGIDTTIAGSLHGLAGSVDGSTGTAALFYRPSGITTDGTHLYVTDAFNYTIRKIEIATGVVTTLAGTAGQAGHVDAAGAAARFNELNGITVNGNYLYVTSTDNTIRMIHKVSGVVNTLAGVSGSSGSSDGFKSEARFHLPMRLTTDGPNLYVTDFGNSTIRKIVLSTGAVSTIAGVVSPQGSEGSHADSPTGQLAHFNQPNGITCDGNNLYVTDSYDNMLRKVVLTSSGWSGPVTTFGASFGAAAQKSIAGITTDGISLYLLDISVNNTSHVIRLVN